MGAVALKCALPGALAGGFLIRGLHICFATRGPFVFAGCANVSPRTTGMGSTNGPRAGNDNFNAPDIDS